MHNNLSSQGLKCIFVEVVVDVEVMEVMLLVEVMEVEMQRASRV